MGISNRDYVRDEPPGNYGSFSTSAGGEWALKYLLIANGVIYFLQAATNETGLVTRWLDLSVTDLVPGFQFWRLLTYGFCHDPHSLGHILFNMWALWLFGKPLQDRFGSRELVTFYLIGILLSGVGHTFYQVAAGSPAGVVGASGGVMAVVFATAVFQPNMTILFMFVIPMQLRYMAILYAVVDTFGMMRGGSNVAHAAHLAGAAFGAAYAYYGWHLTGNLNTWLNSRQTKRKQKEAGLRIYEPPEEDIETKVDQLLNKISEQGETSLTDKEREFLKQASKHYKKP